MPVGYKIRKIKNTVIGAGEDCFYFTLNYKNNGVR